MSFSLHSWKIIANLGAEVVVGCGGYPSLPPEVVANWMRVPSILHEQNAVLGRANRWLSRRATFIAKSFKNVGSGCKIIALETKLYRVEIS